MSITYKLDLISKLLDSEGVYIEEEIENKIKELKYLVYNEYNSIIKQGDFPEKVKTIENLNQVCEKIEAYIENSMCIGKTVVGVMVDDTKSRQELVEDLIGIDERKFALNINNSFPIIYFNGEESLNIINKFNNITELKKEDIKTIFNNLMRDRQVDLRKSVRVIVNSQNTKYKDIVFILFPKFCDKSTNHFKSLLNMTDFMIVDSKKVHLSLQYLEKIDYNKKIYIKDDNLNITKRNNIKVFKFENDILKQNNKAVCNVDFESYIDNILLNQIIYYTDKNKILNQNILALRKSIIIKEDNVLKNLKLSLEKELDLNKKILSQSMILRKKFFDLANDIEKIIEEQINIKDIKILNEPSKYILYDRINKLIQLKEMDNLDKLINKINCSNSDMYNILILRIQKDIGKNLDKFGLNKLLNNNSKEDYILKAKIEFREELNLNNLQIKEIINNIDYLTTKDEFYLKSLVVKDTNEVKYKKYLRRAADLYHEEAIKLLYDVTLAEEDNIQEMKHLASLLSKDANYYLANYYKKEKFLKSLFYLKVAAALLNLDAIYDLANICYSRKDNENAIKLYDYLVLQNYNNDDCLLKLGLCTYYTNQVQKAVSILEKCNHKKAYFVLGKIYEYGEGRMKDLNKAMQYYKKASDLGDDKSKTRYIKIKTRLENMSQKKSTQRSDYSSSTSYSSYSSSSSYSSGGCFVTTAACKALGKEDDCEELLRFKQLRDTYIINQPDGEEIIAQYYKIAPTIVEEIEKTKQPIQEYKFIWNKYIVVCYEYLLNGEYEQMKLWYIEMVKYLTEKYLDNVK